MQTIAPIMDNGPTHAPKQLEKWLSEQAAEQGWDVTFQVYCLPKNASWLDQIEIWFSIVQRKLLQPYRFSTTTELEQAIAEFIAYYN